MAFSVPKRDLRDDEFAAALDRCGRVAGFLTLSAVGIAVLYFASLYVISR